MPAVSWASRHQHAGHGGGMTVMVVDVYVCGLFTNSRHNASLARLSPRALALRAPALGKAWLCARGRRQTALAKSFCFCSRSPSHVCPPKALVLLALRVA